MLKKKENPDVLKVIKKLDENILCKVDFTGTNIDSHKFFIIKRLCKLWDIDRNYVSICISGGENGCGRWSNYLKSILETMILIENTWEDAFIDNIDFDVADDIFYVTLIIKIR